MKIAVADAPTVAVEYMEKTILPKASGLQKFAVGAAMFAVAHRATAMTQHPDLLRAATALGVVGEDGHIDMDYTRDMAKSAMQQAGGSLAVMGYVMDATDIEALYQAAQKVAR